MLYQDSERKVFLIREALGVHPETKRPLFADYVRVDTILSSGEVDCKTTML